MIHCNILRQELLKGLSLFSRSLFNQSLENTVCWSAHAAAYHHAPPRPCSWGKREGKADKIIKWASEGGSRGSMSHLKRGPSSIPPATILCPGFSPPLTPSCDPFVGEKWSRSLEPANYRALTSALLNPKCWRTFQQLTDLCFCECVHICCFIFIEMWAQQRKCLFHRCYKAALPRGKSQLIRNAQNTECDCLANNCAQW